MALSLKTRVLLGLAAVCLCIVAAPLPVPAEAPVRGDATAALAADDGTAQAADGQGTAAVSVASEPSGLDREVVPNLPFTGLDVLAFFGVAVVLTLLAWILHRLSAPR